MVEIKDETHENHDHDFGLECTECAGDLGEAPGITPWYREPRVILLAVAAVLTGVGLSLWLAGAPEIAVNAVMGAAIVAGVIYPARAAWQSLKARTLTINTLLIAATAGALALNLWEEAATLVVVFSLGGVLETFAVERARNSLKKLVELAPREAHVVRDGVEALVPVGTISIGEFIHVRPGERIPLDGTVSAGVSNVDQAPITGESIPVFKKPGDPVFAGSINQQGLLEVTVTNLAKDTTLAKVIASVEEHQARKSRYQRFGERFGRLYTPIMFAVALGVVALPPLLTGATFQDWLYRGLVVLVVSCSCGIALSVPVAVVSAIANAARQGVLFKGGAYLELLSGIRTVVFDKTGTLTYGEPVMTDIHAFGGLSVDDLLLLAASIEAKSGHPIANAVVAAALDRDMKLDKPEGFTALPGLGARAVIKGKTYHAGNRKLIEAHGTSLESAAGFIEDLEGRGKTLVFITEDDILIGLIAVADTIRESASATVKELRKQGQRRLVMLTGDNEKTALNICAELALDECRAALLPGQKAGIVNELEYAYGPIAMVGDGINDAPALAAATVGIAMGAAGSDIAVETGDVVLMSDDLTKLPFAISLSRRAAAVMQFNIAVALVVVLTLVTLALFGRIDLVPGLVVNELAAFLIILNSLRLLV